MALSFSWEPFREEAGIFCMPSGRFAMNIWPILVPAVGPGMEAFPRRPPGWGFGFRDCCAEPKKAIMVSFVSAAERVAPPTCPSPPKPGDRGRGSPCSGHEGCSALPMLVGAGAEPYVVQRKSLVPQQGEANRRRSEQQAASPW